MSEWKECKLGEAPLSIIDGDRGKNYPNQNEFKNSGYCLFLSTKNVRLTGFDFADCQFISKERDVILRKGKLNKYDLVLTTRGTVGNIGYYSEDVNYENIRINSGMVIIRPQIEQLVPKFNFYIFRYLQKDFLTFTTGSAQPQLPIRDLNEIEIKLPPLPEQKTIASILSSLDDKIDLLHRQNTTLEKMAETIFRQWFVEEAKEEWEYQLNLGDLIESVSITHKFPNSEIVFLNTSDIYLGNVLEHSPTVVKGLPGQAKKSIQKDDILFSEIRPANGRWAYVEFEADDYVVSTKLMVLRSKKVISQAFVYFYLTNSSTVDWLQMIAESRSGTFPQITFDQLRDMKISVPSNEILNNTIDWCEASLKKIKSNQIQIRTLTSMRDNLLPKLMSGEVRVKL